MRGFKVVKDEFRQHKFDAPSRYADNKITIGEEKFYVPDIILPCRADNRSAGYDLFLANDATLTPGKRLLIFTDVKAYMAYDEFLAIYIRSSLALKQGIMLSNNVGIVDSSYYENEANDGNIGISLVNTGGQTIELKQGDRVAQGIFIKYQLAENDEVMQATRKGGFGHTGN